MSITRSSLYGTDLQRGSISRSAFQAKPPPVSVIERVLKVVPQVQAQSLEVPEVTSPVNSSEIKPVSRSARFSGYATPTDIKKVPNEAVPLSVKLSPAVPQSAESSLESTPSEANSFSVDGMEPEDSSDDHKKTAEGDAPEITNVSARGVPVNLKTPGGRAQRFGAPVAGDDAVPPENEDADETDSTDESTADPVAPSPPIPPFVKKAVTPRSARFSAGAGIGLDVQPSDESEPNDYESDSGGARSSSTPSTSSSFNQETFLGLIDRITPVGDEWAVGQAYKEGETINIKGNAIRDLIPGNEYEFFGKTTHHPKYGEGFDVTSAIDHIRPDRRSIEKFIIRNFKDIGPKKVEAYITKMLVGAPDKDKRLEELRQKLLFAPWTIDFSSVSKKASFKSDDKSSPVLAAVQRDFATKLGGISGMRDNILKLLASKMMLKVAQLTAENGNDRDGPTAMIDPDIVQKCWAALKDDPYEPIKDIPGYGFSSADLINKSLIHMPRNSPNRLRALALFAIDAGCIGSGHVYLTESQAIKAISEVDGSISANEAIEFALEEALLIADDEFGEIRYYTPSLYDAESCLADGIKDMLKDSTPLSSLSVADLTKKINAACKQIPALAKNGLDASQMEALIGIIQSPVRIHTLTAGPGCGKSALMEVLSIVLSKEAMVFVGPTGKAAKVLNNKVSASGRSASTIHSALKGAGRKDFKVNADEPLSGRVLVCDETSMDDVELAASLVEAANTGMHVIFLGDEKQLASVGPGRFLRDLKAIQGIDHHRLTKTHRNSGGILDIVNQIDQGKIDCVDREAVKFSHGLASAEMDFHKISQSYVNSVSRLGFENVILLMSMRKGDAKTAGWNTTYANEQLRNLCNPNAEKIPGTLFFVRDRILIKKNMIVPKAGEELSEDDYENEDGPGERVVNGDTGMITSFERDKRNPANGSAKIIRVKLDDGRLVDLPGGQSLETLQHSYALTVHSSQGSEYKHVIFVGTPGMPSFINQTMLFTGLSRARDYLEVYADDDVLRKIARTKAPERNSALVQRVTGFAAVDSNKPGGNGRADRFGAMRNFG